MVRKFLSVALLSFALVASSVAVDTSVAANVATQQQMQEKLKMLEQHMNKVIESMFATMRDQQVELYVVHYDDISWLETNYINDTVKGDKIIDVMAVDFEKMIMPCMKTFVDKFDVPGMVLTPEELAQVKESLELTMKSFEFSNMIRMSLKEMAHVRSKAHQIVMKKRAAAKA